MLLRPIADFLYFTSGVTRASSCWLRSAGELLCEELRRNCSVCLALSLSEVPLDLHVCTAIHERGVEAG